jgi:hypothetical protein
MQDCDGNSIGMYQTEGRDDDLIYASKKAIHFCLLPPPLQDQCTYAYTSYSIVVSGRA